MEFVSFQERARSVLGEQWRSRLALALLCSPERFAHRPQPIIVAVLELVEFALAQGIAEPELPSRWIGRASPADAELRARFVQMLGNDRVTKSVAAAVGMRKQTVRLAWSCRRKSERCSTDLAAIVELLELLRAKDIPRAAWPTRWQPLPRAKPARTKGKDTVTAPGREIQLRACAVLGNERPNARLAKALGLSREYLASIWREERDSRGYQARAQPYLLATIELLETLVAEGVPIERWPRRWREMPMARIGGRPRKEPNSEIRTQELEEPVS